MKPEITVYEDVTLITLQNIPADISFIAEVFDKIAGMGVDVDMISLSPVQGERTSLSFTIKDEDLVKILSYTSKLDDGSVKSIVSSGNCKISVNDDAMENCPGVAAKVFALAAQAKTEIRLITTSESQISLLVTKSDFDSAYAKIQEIAE
ncbi:MAG: hypothetical protein IJ192_15415 [Clostridia bacterium]|nr:hypothetical protein [Clostridia bacterium]